MPLPPVCLSFASIEATGGSNGIADIKTFTARGLYGALVATGVLGFAKNTNATATPLPEQCVRDQIANLPEWLAPGAIKIGLCPNVETVHLVARYLREHPQVPVVLDPVLVSHHGFPLVQPEVIGAVREHLLPRATIATPNRFEAALLTGLDECVGQEDMEAAAKKLFDEHGCPALITGGSVLPRGTDVFWGVDGVSHFPGGELERPHIYGTTSSLAAAITAELARGESLREGIAVAKGYVTSLIETAPENPAFGNPGYGPLCHCLTSSPKEETSSWVQDLP